MKHVSCGGAHTLVCSAAGDIFSSGSNSCGQLGLGHQGDRDTFQCVSLEDTTDAANVSAVAIASATSCKNVSILPLKFAFVHAGEEFSAFISRNKHVYTCGMGIAGSLGHGTFENLNIPTEIRNLSHIEMLAASGQSQLYAINSTGDVYSWGSPDYSPSDLIGAMGLTADRTSSGEGQRTVAEPMRISIMSKRKQISQFVCGRKHNLVVVNGAYGPNCYILKGLNVANTSMMDDEDAEIEESGYKERLVDLMGQTVGKAVAGAGEGKEEEEEEEKDEGLSPVKSFDKERGGAGSNSPSKQRLHLLFLPVTQLEAGRRLSFTIQSRDISHRKLETPGAVFQASITHDSLDYERKLEKQGLELVHSVDIDDNLDGQYSGVVMLKLAGTYRLNVTLDGLAIQGSPFELSVNATNLSPQRCFCWFGAFAVTSSGGKALPVDDSGEVNLLDDDKKEEGWTGDHIAAAYADTIVFTVSSRDKFGNKCSATDHAVVVKAEHVGVMGEAAPSISLHAERTPTAEAETESESWSGSSLGLFPCGFDTRKCKESCFYLLHVAIDYFGESRAVEGSPFKLALGKQRPKRQEKEVEIEVAQEDEEGGMTVQVSKAHTTIKAADDSALGRSLAGQEAEDDQAEQFLQELTRAELTQRRAEEALKKHRAAIKAKKERERTAKKAKRTGGGFVIEYSKDV